MQCCGQVLPAPHPHKAGRGRHRQNIHTPGRRRPNPTKETPRTSSCSSRCLTDCTSRRASWVAQRSHRSTRSQTCARASSKILSSSLLRDRERGLV
ncbi:hypothetical protein F751_2968 [Auxenochlorella protothecoides]|uniref:Uncharacterized protein n=1 Tax=Auxenochlorella protothecoides TaxID=3075 RepID=A0A087SAM3_AUXPR|nr:hypothetical protein F751_2968 [Auxenochlorella protothecoides]KFM22777.1 hypothetical protein F751_2968 [Auxenochlorella protothecoides]